MTSWQKVSLVLAILTALFLCGIGIAIAEASMLGIILCIIGTILVPGIGFSLKKRFKEK
ncbi:DUF5325 family protein [Ammoniphilus resinae]|uniref:Membrane protein n=1 Tax=Ammoniphilus resinae TaxID=861532 RepID=A0ABS4GIU3_9BACL|nr:putative membrane protein [Ammoniphilus resinae]